MKAMRMGAASNITASTQAGDSFGSNGTQVPGKLMCGLKKSLEG
jgi:hypothetical protein